MHGRQIIDKDYDNSKRQNMNLLKGHWPNFGANLFCITAVGFSKKCPLFIMRILQILISPLKFLNQSKIFLQLWNVMNHLFAIEIVCVTFND